MSFDLTQLGLVRRAEEFRVGSTRLGQFAAAINDTNLAHLEGQVATPVFASVPPMQPATEALRAVTQAFCFHGEHDFRFHLPIRPGMRLFSQAEVYGVLSTSAGVSIVVKSQTRTGAGELVDEQYLTGFVRGATLARDVGQPAPDHRVPDEATSGPPIAEVSYPLAMDQTRRYADAARDYSEYALRLDAARARGLDGVLVHGMLTMALASRAVVSSACGDDSSRLKRLAGRFSRPLHLVPDQHVTTRLWKLGRQNAKTTFAFDAADAAGQIVVKHGIAEIAE